MAIEHAERFGLSQLHQLRGRVGRGAADSTCVLLFEEPVGEVAKLRLKVIFEHTDGFEIARQDLSSGGQASSSGPARPACRCCGSPTSSGTSPWSSRRDLADDLLARDPESAQAHLSRWLGGRVEFINS
jgi:ATP-dependent DNA helicase RecG